MKSLLMNIGNKKKTNKNMFSNKKEMRHSRNSKSKSSTSRSGGISPSVEEFDEMMSKTSGNNDKKKNMFKKKK
jgi:hypothetical protein